METAPKKTRKAIQRRSAETYLLITLLSFAVSVSLTRLFLELTGYPQLGDNELHFAHVLWGGLFLFTALVIQLIFANRWVYTIGALVGGVGVGLFIDEVGKFITQSNDYFYPTAAPIIYAFFLITVLVYLRIKHPKKLDTRALLYNVLTDLEEVLDQDLSEEERKGILERLELIIQQEDQPNLSLLARNLKEFITSGMLYIVPKRLSWIERLRNQILEIEKRYLNRSRYKAILAGGLFAWGIWSLWTPISFLITIRTPQQLAVILTDLVSNRLVRNPSGLNWFEAHIGLVGAVGLLMLSVAILLTIGQEQRAVAVGSLGLLLSLTVVNLLLFYFDQFSTIFDAIFQFCLLMGLFRYRTLFLKELVPVE